MISPFYRRLGGLVRPALALAALAVAAVGAAAAGEPVAAAAPDPSGTAVATEARVAGDESRTRFIVDLSRNVDLNAFTLADPYRVVIDLPQMMFRFPARTGEGGRGLVKAFRYG